VLFYTLRDSKKHKQAQQIARNTVKIDGRKRSQKGIITAVNKQNQERKTTMKTKICGICGNQYIGFGHNPQPIQTPPNAQCCNDCNVNVVIPMRLNMIKENKSWELKAQ